MAFWLLLSNNAPDAVMSELRPIRRAGGGWGGAEGATGAGEGQTGTIKKLKMQKQSDAKPCPLRGVHLVLLAKPRPLYGGYLVLQAKNRPYTAAILSCGLLLLLLLLLSWLPGDVIALCVLSALGVESLSVGVLWAGPGEDREAGREVEGRYAAISSARRSDVGAHFPKPASFCRNSTAVPWTAR